VYYSHGFDPLANTFSLEVQELCHITEWCKSWDSTLQPDTEPKHHDDLSFLMDRESDDRLAIWVLVQLPSLILGLSRRIKHIPEYLSAFAEDHGRKSVDDCARETLRPSSAIAAYGRRRPKLGERPPFAAEEATSAEWARRVLGGLRRKNEGYHGRKPIEASLHRYGHEIALYLPGGFRSSLSTLYRELLV